MPLSEAGGARGGMGLKRAFASGSGVREHLRRCPLMWRPYCPACDLLPHQLLNCTQPLLCLPLCTQKRLSRPCCSLPPRQPPPALLARPPPTRQTAPPPKGQAPPPPKKLPMVSWPSLPGRAPLCPACSRLCRLRSSTAAQVLAAPELAACVMPGRVLDRPVGPPFNRCIPTTLPCLSVPTLRATAPQTACGRQWPPPTWARPTTLAPPSASAPAPASMATSLPTPTLMCAPSRPARCLGSPAVGRGPGLRLRRAFAEDTKTLPSHRPLRTHTHSHSHHHPAHFLACLGFKFV